MTAEHKPRTHPRCTCGVLAVDHRPSHNPLAWPVCTCGARAINHRVKHGYQGQGDTCAKCFLPPERHISQGPGHKSEYRFDFVGLDGEGIGRRPHRYVMLCAATTEGQQWAIEDAKGLRSAAMLDWLVTTLDRCRVFGYGFGYDLTHIVADLPDASVYDLLRPSRRFIRGKIRPVKWGRYTLDWLQGKLIITRGALRVVVWDLLKFYQQTFVATLADWGIASEGIESMKARRGSFRARDMGPMRDYCLTECRQLAELAKQLLAAHTHAGLTLTSYYGPGSTASVLLGQMQVKDYAKPTPPEMAEPIACAFFGGRFEHSMMGEVTPVYGYDISSAYPYQAYHLPCLACGRWEHVRAMVKAEVEDCTTALVRYSYEGSPSDVWAPYPHRSAKGTICYPYRGSGWVWLPEYLAAEGMGRTRLHEAWVYRTDCDCRPFARLAEVYRERCSLGKTGKGIVLKLGPNSVYGKLAQSKGHNPPFQNWVWAGLITSGTRAQVLTAIRSAPSSSDIIAVATDGIYSRVPLSLPKPLDTGTFDLPKPLGGWEETVSDEGMLFVKPGIYLSLGSDKVLVKARGIGRRALAADREAIIDAFRRGEREWTIEVERFGGAKSCVTPRGKRPGYGQWSKMAIHIAFECPNRTETMGLHARDTASVPYDASLITAEDLQIRQQSDIGYDQPF